jgi:hypothetical protein
LANQSRGNLEELKDVRHAPALPRENVMPYLAKYVVARFCPFERSFFVLRPSLSTRGSSLACIPSSERICSALSPSLFFDTKATIWSRAAEISSAERRGRRPALLPCESTLVDPSARPRTCGPASPRSSWREAPLIASITESANEEARSASRERKLDIAGA